MSLEQAVADLEASQDQLNNSIILIADNLVQKIDILEKGSVNGVATLDANAKVPEAQLPDRVQYKESNGNVLTTGNILPTTNGLQEIGSPTNRFKAIYVNEAYLSTNTLYIGDTAILGTDQDTVMIQADPNQSISLVTTGTGQTTISSETSVGIQTNGTNADVRIQTNGIGSRVRLTSGTEAIITAPTTRFEGSTDITGNQNVVGNLTVSGNVSFLGTSTTVNSTTVTTKDNIIVVNQGEVGSGVTAQYAGIQVDRGDLADSRIVFDEVEDRWKAGVVGSEKTLAYTDELNSGLISKQDTITGAATSITTSNLLSNRVLVSDISGKVAVAANISNDELEHLNGVTSNIQTQLDSKIAANTGITGATATKVTYDSKGLITDSAVLLASDIPALDASKISTGTLPVSRGGTGVSTLTGIVKGNGTGSMTTAVAGTDYVTPTGSIAGNAGTATKLATARTLALSGTVTGSATFDGSANMTISTTVANATTSTSGLMSNTDKSKLDGIAANANNYTHPTGDGDLHVPATGTTNSGKVLTAGATAGSLSWTSIPAAPVTSVAGKTGVVTLTKTDVGLGNVDNTADSAKAVLSATRLATARTINGVSFDGTANITVSDATKIPSTEKGVANGVATLGADSRIPSDQMAKTATDLTVSSLKEKYAAIPASNIDLSLGNVFSKTITASTTFTLSNIPASTNAYAFILELTNAGSFPITWFTGVKWGAGISPVFTTTGIDVLGFYTRDGGTTWRGTVISKNSK